MEIRARPLLPGEGEGEAVVVEALSFYGEVDPREGRLNDGRSITERVLLIGRVRGSTVGSYIVYGLRYYGKAPRAIIVEGDADPIVVAGAVMAGIPLYDRARGILTAARDGDVIRYARDGTIRIVQRGVG